MRVRDLLHSFGVFAVTIIDPTFSANVTERMCMTSLMHIVSLRSKLLNPTFSLLGTCFMLIFDMTGPYGVFTFMIIDHSFGNDCRIQHTFYTLSLSHSYTYIRTYVRTYVHLYIHKCKKRSQNTQNTLGTRNLSKDVCLKDSYTMNAKKLFQYYYII